MIQWNRSRAKRDVSRARSARETNGGSGGPPPEIFIKKAGKWCKSRQPCLFFQQIIVYEINTIL